MRLLGKQHASKPVTADDRAMSERHLARRAELDKAKPTIANLRSSLYYNKRHAAEHEKAAKDREKLLKKMVKARLPK